MPRPTTESRLADIHAEALEEFDDIQAAAREVRMGCLADRRFCLLPGAQWWRDEETNLDLECQFENRPRFEFNRVHLAVIRLYSEYRNNRITVDFQPKDGTPDDELADTCDGLHRADERACTADEAYDNCFEEGVTGGMGAWRLRTKYEDEDNDENERQRVVMEPIFDADSTVFFNLDAKRYDKADAERCYVLTPYSRKGYKAEWDDDPTDWPKDIQRTQFDWSTSDIVWVCEHYRVEKKSELLTFWRGLVDDEPDMRVFQHEFDDDPDYEPQLKARGFRKVREKRVKRQRVRKYILSGGKVLEDCGYIAGRHIPIVPFYGKRWVIDGVERCMGHVRLAKDAQRLSNMLLSWLAEMATRFDIEKPIFTPEQVLRHAQMWARDNVDKFPYLLVDPITDAAGQKVPAGPIAYTKAPTIPAPLAALAQIAEQALQDLLGNQQAGEEIKPNISGKAVELIQNRLDMQVFIYMSNLAKSMKRSGEIWLSMTKDIAIEEERSTKVITADGEPGRVVLNRPAFDEKAGKVYIENDLTRAAMDVEVDVGPSSSSRRAATVRALTGMMSLTQDPETLQVLSGLALMNLEGEGIGDARDYFRQKLVRMGVIKPTKEEEAELAQEQAGRQPDPQSRYLLAAADQAQAEAVLGRAKTLDTLAGADLKHAQAQKALAEAEGVPVTNALQAARDLREGWAQAPGNPAA